MTTPSHEPRVSARAAASDLLTPTALSLAAAAALAFAYRDLLSFGARAGVRQGVEYWMFVPNDRAPIVAICISAWLVWRRWPRLKALPRSGAGPGAVAVAFAIGAAIQAWAIHVQAQDLQAFSLMANAAGIVLLTWGAPGLRLMALPIAFLVFAIPLPAPVLVTLLWKLRLFTAQYTGWLLYMLGIPSLVSGDQILGASQSFQVVEGCSGLRSVETLTMLVVLLIELFGRGGLHAFLLLVSAPLVALALNGVRVLTLVLNPTSDVVAIHSLQGIAILLVGLLLVYGFDGLLARWLPKRAAAGASPAREPGRTHAPGSLVPAGTALAVGLVTASFALWVPVWNGPRPPHTLTAAVDGALAGVPYDTVAADDYFLGHVAFREALDRRYRLDRFSWVEVFAGAGDITDRRTSILSPITARPGSGWNRLHSGHTDLTREGPRVAWSVMQKGVDRRLVYHWHIGLDPLWLETLRSFLGLDSSGLQRHHPVLTVRLSTPVDLSENGRAQAERRLRDMYEQLQPALATASIYPAG